MHPILSIAGSDPSGGAGLQADLKTFHQHGLYGMAVATLLTVQNTQRVSQVFLLDPVLVRAQLDAIMEDITPLAIKIGALGDAEIMKQVAMGLRSYPGAIVLDPVMISKHGAALLAEDAIETLRVHLFPLVTLLTPNIVEAEILAGMRIDSRTDSLIAANRLRKQGIRNVLIKGGHLPDSPCDVLVGESGDSFLEGDRIVSSNLHGTGCTLSSAIASQLVLGESMQSACEKSKRWIEQAIRLAPQLGKGVGPLNHCAPVVLFRNEP